MNAPAPHPVGTPTARSAPMRIPVAAWLLGLPGALCLIAGAAVLLGGFGAVHPLLADTGAGIVLIVSAVALLGSAAFPLVLARLADRDQG